MLVIHELKCQELSQTVNHVSDKQEKLLDISWPKKSLF